MSRGEMLAPNGGFYSTRDSDSEGHEGEFFVWIPDEIRSVLGGSASAFCLPKTGDEGGGIRGTAARLRLRENPYKFSRKL